MSLSTKFLWILKPVDFARIYGTFQEITAQANDGVVNTARAKRISRDFTGSKKKIKFVYQSGRQRLDVRYL